MQVLCKNKSRRKTFNIKLTPIFVIAALLVVSHQTPTAAVDHGTDDHGDGIAPLQSPVYTKDVFGGGVGSGIITLQPLSGNEGGGVDQCSELNHFLQMYKFCSIYSIVC